MKLQEAAAKLSREQIIEHARRIMQTLHRPYVMATVSVEGKPHVRWMGAFVFEEPFTIYMETYRGSRKVDDLEENPNAELLLNTEDFSQQLLVSGCATMEDSPQIRQEVWDSIADSRDYFAGVDDPNFVVIKFTAQQVELYLERNQRSPYVTML